MLLLATALVKAKVRCREICFLLRDRRGFVTTRCLRPYNHVFVSSYTEIHITPNSSCTISEWREFRSQSMSPGLTDNILIGKRNILLFRDFLVFAFFSTRGITAKASKEEQCAAPTAITMQPNTNKKPSCCYMD